MIGGSLPLAPLDADPSAPARVRNSCCVFNPEGALAACYDKLHLFRFDNGREQYDEGRVLEAGETPEGGIAREVKEETNLDATALKLIGTAIGEEA